MNDSPEPHIAHQLRRKETLRSMKVSRNRSRQHSSREGLTVISAADQLMLTPVSLWSEGGGHLRRAHQQSDCRRAETAESRAAHAQVSGFTCSPSVLQP